MGMINELKARVFVNLENRGFKVVLNYRMEISTIRGYQNINLDVVVMGPEDKPIASFYIGPPKQRKLIKYRMTKLKFFTIQDQDNLSPGIVEFYLWYIGKYLK